MKKSKKVLRLKGEVKVAIFAIVGITLCILAFSALEESTKNNAIERCGGEDNIVLKYTNTGDRYYVCK